MSTTQHTPGPWTVNQLIDTDNPENDGIFVASLAPIYPNSNSSPKVGTLAQCYAVKDTRHTAEVMANARLIAAAPELLTDGELLAIAIQDFLENSDRSMAAAESVARRVATFRATAAKAKGKS